jgi:hypothetical protein
LLAEVVLDAEHVSADAFAAVGEPVAVTLQPSLLQDHLVVAIGTVYLDVKRLLARALEAFGLGLVAMRFGDQAVQVRLQHGVQLAS